MNLKQTLQYFEHYTFVFRLFDGHADVIVRPEARHRATTVSADNLLHLIKAKSLAVDLQKSFQPASNKVVAFLIASSDVTGSQVTLEFVTLAKVTTVLGITKHHVGACIKQFACLLVQRKLAARDHSSNGAQLVAQTFRRNVGHPRRCLRLTIHDEKSPTTPETQLLQLTNAISRQTAAGLRERLKPW